LFSRAKQQAFEKWGSLLDQSNNITCIGVDGKVDNQTCEFEEVIMNGELYLKKTIMPQHHLTFTNETNREGKYLTHKNLPLKGATGLVMASKALEVLQEYDSVDSLIAVLVDNTSLNTGQENGLVHQMELLLGHNLQMIGCSLHQNELPLRSIFKKFDGASSGPSVFAGILGKQCKADFHKEPVQCFKKIQTSFPEFDINCSYEDLSQDQELLLHYLKGINNGFIEDRISRRKIGPLCHSRWLTLAIRLMALYTRTLHPSEELIKLVTFIVQCYAPSWFTIKQSSSLRDSPKILHKAIESINKVPDLEIRALFRESIQRNCYCLLPENFLYAMILDDNRDVRRKGWKLIHDLRGQLPYGRKISEINWEAGSWHELVDFSTLQCYNEPASVRKLSIHQVKKLASTGKELDLPILPSHSQSVERSVKLVSEACKNKYGFDGRHSSILTKMASRIRRPNFESKGYYCQDYESDE